MLLITTIFKISIFLKTTAEMSHDQHQHVVSNQPQSYGAPPGPQQYQMVPPGSPQPVGGKVQLNFEFNIVFENC